VLATPVAEVGRDHDYDWAIVEPSSMRSIIQLAGRVWRHRPEKIANEPNILLMQYNIRYFKRRHAKAPIFTRPGFETLAIKPTSYDLNRLITDEQLAQIDARPRIVSPIDSSLKKKKAETSTTSMLTGILTQQPIEHTLICSKSRLFETAYRKTIGY